MWRNLKFIHIWHVLDVENVSTYVMRRNLKLLHKVHMWRKFRFLHICHVEKFEITPHVEKYQNSPHLSCIDIWNFSTWQFYSPQIYWWDWWKISGMQSIFAFLMRSWKEQINSGNRRELGVKPLRPAKKFTWSFSSSVSSLASFLS